MYVSAHTYSHPLLTNLNLFSISVLFSGHVDDDKFEEVTNIPVEHCYDIKGILSVRLQKHSAPWITITAYRCLVCYEKIGCPMCTNENPESGDNHQFESSTEAAASLMNLQKSEDPSGNPNTQNVEGDDVNRSQNQPTETSTVDTNK